MDFSKGVLFDPGYSKYTLPFSQNIDAAYNMILSIKAPHQRKFKFQMVYPQLLKLLEHTISFYLGCLLWATFISKNFKDNPKEILDNHYIGQKIKEDEMLFEVNYAIGYIEKLKKDCKYYLVEAKSSADIKLPLAIKEPSQDDLNKILEQIELVVKSGELKELFKVKKLIID